MRKSPKFSPEVVERAVRMVFDVKDQYPSQWAAIESIAGKIGCTAETLRKWVRQGERDSGARPGPTTAQQQRVKDLEREVRELRKTNEILKLASAYFAQAESRPPSQEVNAFIDEHRARLGVEPICTALQVAPSAYRRHAARQRNRALLPERAKRDAQLLPEVQRVFDQNLQVYGADKVWRQLHREGLVVTRCTVERLMRLAGLRGMRRGKSVRTTVPDAKAACPLDRVNRQFEADRPNQLWVADFSAP
jgi:transposase-like protein